MGIVLPCPIPCDSNNNSLDIITNNNNNTSLYSQPSLPSVPSLQLHHPKTGVLVHSLQTLSGHSSYISSLVLAGNLLFSSSSDGTVRLWPLRRSSGAAAAVVVSSAAVKSVVVSGDKLFTAHQDHKVRVWRIEEEEEEEDEEKSDNISSERVFKCVATLPTLNDRVSRMFSAKNYVEVRRHKKRTWVHHNDAVSALAVSSDGFALYTASWDRTFKVWRASDFKCVESVANAHDDAINAIALAPDGLVFTGSADTKIKVWWREGGHHQDSHSLVQTLEKHRSAVNALAVSTDGRVLYSGACDRSILVWERENNESINNVSFIVVGALRGHSKAILSLGVVGDIVCSGSADCSVRVWKRVGFNNKNYACLTVLEGHTRPVKCLSLALDNHDSNGSSYMVYSGGLDSQIRVWKIFVPSSNFF